MREMLFRGKRRTETEYINGWIEGYYIKSESFVKMSLETTSPNYGKVKSVMYHYILGDSFTRSLSESNGYFHELKTRLGWSEVDPETIGQYTGFDDKNGNKILRQYCKCKI